MKSQIAALLAAAVLTAPAFAQTSPRAGDMPDYGALASGAAASRTTGAVVGAAVGTGEAPAYPATASVRIRSERTSAGTLAGVGEAPAYPQPTVTAATRPMRSFEHRHDVWMTSPN